MTLDEFHLLLGQTIMFCQQIEHDIKHIYAAICDGDYIDNIKRVNKRPLGEVVNALMEIDLESGSPYISERDYVFLKQVTKKRNHWCHDAYQNFIYEEDFVDGKNYAEEYRMLFDDNRNLALVADIIQRVRRQAQRDFRNF